MGSRVRTNPHNQLREVPDIHALMQARLVSLDVFVEPDLPNGNVPGCASPAQAGLRPFNGVHWLSFNFSLPIVLI
jgi:hypothetical protein